MKGLVLVDGYYKANINFKDKQRRRSTHTGHRPTAERIATRMKARRDELLTGQVTLPPGADPWDYIFEGVTSAPESRTTELPVGIDDFQKEYIASLGPPKISKTFAKTQAIYLGHFVRFREKNPTLTKALKDWQPQHIEKYRLWRLSPKGRNRKGQKIRVIVSMEWPKENDADLNPSDNDWHTPILRAADISGIPGATVDEHPFAETGASAPRAFLCCYSAQSGIQEVGGSAIRRPSS